MECACLCATCSAPAVVVFVASSQLATYTPGMDAHVLMWGQCEPATLKGWWAWGVYGMCAAVFMSALASTLQM